MCFDYQRIRSQGKKRVFFFKNASGQNMWGDRPLSPFPTSPPSPFRSACPLYTLLFFTPSLIMSEEEKQILLGCKRPLEETLRVCEAFHTKAHPRLGIGTRCAVGQISKQILESFGFGCIPLLCFCNNKHMGLL